MNLRTFNESFANSYKDDMNVRPMKESFEGDLRRRLTDAAQQQMANHVVNMKVYENVLQAAIEEMVPDKSWWEVTDCDIFQDLFNTQDVYGTIDCIIDNLKPEYKDLSESVEFDETKTYVDTNGGFGNRGEKFTGKELKKYYDDNRNTDPIVKGYASFEDWFKDTSDNYLKEVEDEACKGKLKESYDEPEMIGKGYAAPTSIDFVKEVKSKLKYDAFEDLQDVQERMQDTSDKVEEFDAYWQAHKKAIMSHIKEAQDLIPAKYRK